MKSFFAMMSLLLLAGVGCVQSNAPRATQNSDVGQEAQAQNKQKTNGPIINIYNGISGSPGPTSQPSKGAMACGAQTINNSVVVGEQAPSIAGSGGHTAGSQESGQHAPAEATQDNRPTTDITLTIPGGVADKIAAGLGGIAPASGTSTPTAQPKADPAPVNGNGLNWLDALKGLFGGLTQNKPPPVKAATE